MTRPDGVKGAAVITRADVEAAQAVLDAWEEHLGGSYLLSEHYAPYLRGLITQAITDAHAQGYDEGVTRGRRDIANAVRDALDGEGL